jgi:hypothetical protein
MLKDNPDTVVLSVLNLWRLKPPSPCGGYYHFIVFRPVVSQSPG